MQLVGQRKDLNPGAEYLPSIPLDLLSGLLHPTGDVHGLHQQPPLPLALQLSFVYIFHIAWTLIPLFRWAAVRTWYTLYARLRNVDIFY